MSRVFTKNLSNSCSFGNGAYSPILNGASAISMHAWVNAATLTAGASDGNVIFVAITTNLTGVAIRVNGSGSPKVFRLSGRSKSTDASQNFDGSIAVNTGVWYSVGGVFDFANARMYLFVNGRLDRKSTPTWANTSYTDAGGQSAPDRIGGDGALAATPIQWDGSIAEAAIWRTNIGADGFRRLAQGVPAPRIAPGALAMYCPCAADTSGSIVDLSPSNKVAAITGTIQPGDSNFRRSVSTLAGARRRRIVGTGAPPSAAQDDQADNLPFVTYGGGGGGGSTRAITYEMYQEEQRKQREEWKRRKRLAVHARVVAALLVAGAFDD